MKYKTSISSLIFHVCIQLLQETLSILAIKLIKKKSIEELFSVEL
jgi:hypothetical protein